MISGSRLLRSSIAVTFLVSTMVFFAVLGLRKVGTLESLELATYDWYLRLQPKISVSNSRIILLAISENDSKDKRFKWKITELERTDNFHVLEGDKKLKQGDKIIPFLLT